MTFTDEGSKAYDRYNKRQIQNSVFTDEGTVAYDDFNRKKRQVQKWPDTNGIPYEIYKAKSDYSYKNFFCKKNSYKFGLKNNIFN
jgi:hypothetical protein